MKQTGEALTGSLRDLTGSGKVERDFEWGSNVGKITLAAVSRTRGEGREDGGPVRRPMQLCS